jgi:predicted enzyme related to lactoylglutathione lyase
VGIRKSYSPGAFCWTELETKDAEPARRFYGDLFGWRFDADGVALLGGDAVAGTRPGRTNRWHSFVSVQDPEATAARAVALGGGSADAHAVRDPQGAELRLWKADRGIGATRVNDPGCLVWNELSTTDPRAAARFYCDLFGWTAEGGYQGRDGSYTMLKLDGRLNGGVNDVPAGSADWLVYFAVESVDDTIGRARDAGAAVWVPPITTDIDRFTILSDPQGASFAVVEGEVDS